MCPGHVSWAINALEVEQYVFRFFKGILMIYSTKLCYVFLSSGYWQPCLPSIILNGFPITGAVRVPLFSWFSLPSLFVAKIYAFPVFWAHNCSFYSNLSCFPGFSVYFLFFFLSLASHFSAKYICCSNERKSILFNRSFKDAWFEYNLQVKLQNPYSLVSPPFGFESFKVK